MEAYIKFMKTNNRQVITQFHTVVNAYKKNKAKQGVENDGNLIFERG